MKSFFRGFFATLLIVCALFFGSQWYINRSDNTAAQTWVEDLKNSNEKFQVLLIGIDSLDSKQAENTRSDVMMVLDVDGAKRTASLVSVPRDSRVPIEGHGKTKINHAYAYGKQDLALQTVNENLGLNIPYYIVVDYAFVKDVVDIVGGIDVDVPMDMDYEDPSADPPLYIHLKQGMQTLNGDEALQFVRFRKGYKNADLDRVKAQQAFISSLVNKVKSPGGLLHAPSLFVSYMDHTTSNMPLSKVSRMGLTLISIGEENLTTNTLPGTPKTIDGISYFIVDEAGTDRLLKDLHMKPLK
ncbi:Putative transcriptional regulator yvhJ [Aedoeadaptatus ivorii]|uniref:Transcriptional regulator yvhJ n=1 Tax=Aedoeadaptatus ivorii TaxID=54006 RepID=A0A3S5AJ28_9FIRM|nr:LCP family protein [Peptoniphilus ivorii]MDQ0507676.1 LCP family protein required for cell wall assembly [Peptoniphilus ivorii]VEJ35389.1 Putative transcriptional regulator yvhJ [Peptoniphilus ivorii]